MEGKTAFITGGSSGIGYGIAEALVKEGVNVAITSRSKERADKAATKISKTGIGEVIGLEADVKSLNDHKKAIQTVLEKWGTLDIVIANAGVGHFNSIEELTQQEWLDTMETNLNGPFYTIKASLDALKKSRGFFITISSLAGANFFAGGAAYNASKFGLTGFTQAVMLDLRNHGIRVSTIMPGSVATHFNNHEPSSEDDWKIQIEDIGEMVVNLVKLNARTLPSKIEVRPAIPKNK